jgi:hypothetical protein
LLAEDDDSALYLRFVTHAAAFKIFRTKRFEGYTSFTFPEGMLENVSIHRNDLRAKLTGIRKENASIRSHDVHAKK